MRTWTIECDGGHFKITDDKGQTRAEGHSTAIARRLAALLADCEETLEIGRKVAGEIDRLDPDQFLHGDTVKQIKATANEFNQRMVRHVAGQLANGA